MMTSPRLRLLAALLAITTVAATGCDPKKPAAPSQTAAQTAAQTNGAKAETTAGTAAQTNSGACTYTLASVTPRWTAYKFTSKAPVGGTFNTVKLQEKLPSGPTVADALKDVSITITPASVESKDPARNQTLATKFFGIFKEPEQITGKVTAVKGDDAKGTVDLTVHLNGADKTLTLDYTVTPEGALTATKTVNMITDLGLKDAHDAIHKACEALHTGPDGVSKTWDEVEIKIEAKLEKKC